jgi:hypothetical protein
VRLEAEALGRDDDLLWIRALVTRARIDEENSLGSRVRRN